MKLTKLLVVIFSIVLILGTVYSPLAQVSGWPFPFSSVSPPTLPSISLTDTGGTQRQIASIDGSGNLNLGIGIINKGVWAPGSNFSSTDGTGFDWELTRNVLATGNPGIQFGTVNTAPDVGISRSAASTINITGAVVGNSITATSLTVQGNPNTATLNLFDTTTGAPTPHKFLRTSGGNFQIVNSAFAFAIINLSDDGALTLNNQNIATVPLIISGPAGKTSDYFELKNSAGTIIQKIDANASQINIEQASGSVPLTAQGAVGQTANLFETRDSAFTLLDAFNASGALLLKGDTGFSANPTVNWSSHLETFTGGTAGAAINFFIARKPINITRFVGSLRIQGVGCTTLATIILKKCTAGFVPSTNACTTSVTLSTISVANGTFGFDSGVIAQSAVAGDVVITTETVLPAGCTTFPSGLDLSTEYVMQ